MALENDSISTEEEKQRAQAQGWADADQWKGNPEGWRTAKEFLKKGDEILPILKERVDTLIGQVSGLQTALSRKDEIIQKMMKFHDEDKQQAIDSAIKQLKAKRREAITEGNAEAVEAIDDELDSHKDAKRELEQRQKDAEAANTPDTNQTTVAYQEWIPNNKWYEEDPQMAADADIIAAQYIDTGRFKSELAIMNAVSRRIKTMYPEYFKEQTQGKQAPDGDPVEGAQRTTSRRRKGNKFTYEDLPVDAKKKCDEYIQRKIFAKPEDYVAIYFRDEMNQSR